MAEELSPEASALPIDRAALASYLRGRLPGAGERFEVRQFAGGQSNPTYLIDTGAARFVLRKKPPGQLLPTAHAIDREYRIFRALADTPVPVPRTVLYCEDPALIGTEFFVMEYVAGRIFWDSTLPELEAPERRAVYREMNRVLSELHKLDYAARGLGDYGKPGNYFARQIKRWSQQYASAQTESIASMDRLMQWLPEHVPEGDQSCLVHGDYRLDNMIFHPTEPRVLALLDWELSTLGHPLSDLAYNCMPYHSTFRAPVPLKQIAGEASGIPTQREYVAEYCYRTGRPPIEEFAFYLAFSFFRSASIVQGVYKRGLQGNASSARDAPMMRERALQAAEVGWRIACGDEAM